jgi:hypothetical protein
MHREDRSRARRDRGFDQGFVDIQGVGARIDEHRLRAAQHHRIGRRHEGERGHDHLVARLQAAQQACKLQRHGARRGQQHRMNAELLLQMCMAPLRVRAVAREVTRLERLPDQLQLAPRDRSPVERDRILNLKHGRPSDRSGK